MGQIKFKDEVIYDGPLCTFSIIDGWNDSMAEYYPSISIGFMPDLESICYDTIKIKNFYDPHFQRSCFNVTFDDAMVHDYKNLIKRQKEEKESKKIDLHKVVKVIRGRKVPKGTEGEVFWIGPGFGENRVGLRLIDGTKVFVPVSYVEVVTLDGAFDSEILGINS